MKYKRLTTGKDFDLKDNSARGVCKAINRLAELEDKIEQGTLRFLPCKVGDIVYRISPLGAISEERVLSFSLDEGLLINTVTDSGTYKCYSTLWFGNRLFLTKAEAEKKVEELKVD